MSSKRCSKCGATRPIADFRVRVDSADGYHTICRPCEAQAAKARRAARSGVNDFGDEPTNPGAPSFDDLAVNENVPESHYVRGVSTLVDGQGAIRARWIKTSISAEQHLQNLIVAMKEAAEQWRGVADPVPAPTISDTDLLACYFIGDGHLGMYSWPDETGDAFNLEIAEQHLVAAVEHLVSIAPDADEGLVVSLGDLFHSDNSNGTTTAGTRLDCDTRWAKVMRTGIRVLRRAIDLALKKHRRVRVICETGNHDAHSSMMLGLCLDAFYERDERVTIDTSPAKFHYYRWGSTLLATTHGDTCKVDKLPAVMACDRAQDWGETQYRFWAVGHWHTSSVREFPGCTVETFQTLAPRDAWHAASGYRSQQSMSLKVFHREFGPVNSAVVGIQKVKAILNGNAKDD